MLVTHCMVLKKMYDVSETLYKSNFLNKIAEYYYLRIIKERLAKNITEYNSILEQIRKRGNLYNLRNPLDQIKAKEDKILKELFVKKNNLLQKEKMMLIPFNMLIRWEVKKNNLCAIVN
ncbi:MAG: hypothetical protein ACOX89_09420, partial [Lutispora sp.]